MRFPQHVLPDGAVLIIGGGLAGLYLALKLQPRPAVILAPRTAAGGGASAWAQGGLAAALGVDDSPTRHAEDTLAVGGGLVRPAIARLLAEAGPGVVRDLAALGAPFDRDAEGGFSLSREAGHSRARVARVTGDQAGRAIMTALVAAVKARDSIQLIDGQALCLTQDAQGRVTGALARVNGQIMQLAASDAVIATGGIGGLFEVTTNPPNALGDGLAMAARAGAIIENPEFVQFHPTAIDVGADPAPLATEALRGEGAALVDAAGAPLVDHPDGALAPRDIVARAVHEAKRQGRRPALDARQAIGARFPDAFPTVFAACMAHGLDPRTAVIPVAPAAHYHMGGVQTDADGATSVEGLSVCGEAASTGAHGANRLASNSLLEATVFAARIGERLRETSNPARGRSERAAEPPRALPEALRELRQVMAAECGVERNAAGLTRALETIEALKARHGEANALIAAGLIARAALEREESRGAHFRSDYPEPSDPAKASQLRLDPGQTINQRGAA